MKSARAPPADARELSPEGDGETAFSAPPPVPLRLLPGAFWGREVRRVSREKLQSETVDRRQYVRCSLRSEEITSQGTMSGRLARSPGEHLRVRHRRRRQQARQQQRGVPVQGRQVRALPRRPGKDHVSRTPTSRSSRGGRSGGRGRPGTRTGGASAARGRRVGGPDRGSSRGRRAVPPGSSEREDGERKNADQVGPRWQIIRPSAVANDRPSRVITSRVITSRAILAGQGLLQITGPCGSEQGHHVSRLRLLAGGVIVDVELLPRAG